MLRPRARWGAVILFACALTAACRSERETPPSAQGGDVVAPPSASSAVEIDLTAAFEGAALSFREGHGGLEAAARAHLCRVARDGSVTFVPAGGARPLVVSSSLEGAAAAAAPRLEQDGSVTIDRGVAVERLRNTTEGLSQTWELARAPSPTRDLVVRVATRGLAYVGQTESGHHFAAGGEPGVRYGNATFVDRGGRRTPLVVRREGAGLAVLVPRAVLDAAEYPAVVDPVLGAETVLDPPGTLTAGGAPQVAVAPGPAGAHLVVWSQGDAVVARRVLTDGTLPGPDVITPLRSTAPAVAWDPVAGHWLVVARSTLSAVAGAWRAVRVGGNGSLVDAQPFTVVETGSQFVSAPLAVTFDGTSWVVAGDRYEPLTGVARLDAVRVTGKVASPPVKLADAIANAVVDVACGATSCGVVWHGTQGNAPLSFGRVSKAGAALDPLGGVSLGTVGLGRRASVATDGTSFLVAWSSPSSGRLATRIAADGTILDAPPLVVAPGVGSTSTCWNGVDFVVGHQTGTTLSARRIAPTGTFTDPSPLPLLTVAGAYSTVRLACAGTAHLAVVPSSAGIRVARADATLTPLDVSPGILVSGAASRQRLAAAAYSGAGWLVAWVDDRTSPSAIYAVRLSSAGAPSGPAFVLAADSNTVDVASDGTDFLAVWGVGAMGVTTGRRVLAARVSGATGQVVDATPIEVTTSMSTDSGASRPRVAYDGKNYVIVWTDKRNRGYTVDDVYAARVSSAGALLDPAGIPVAVAPERQIAPAVAGSGAGSLVVWSDARDDWPSYDLFAARLGQDGAVLDPSGVAVVRAGHEQREAAAAWDGQGYQVAWIDGRRASDGRQYDVYTARVSAAGKPLDPLGRLVGESPDYPLPAITGMSDGRTSLVAWDHWSFDPTRARGAWIRAGSGEVLDPGGVDVAGDTARDVALAPAGPARALLVYSRLAPGTQLGHRVLARFVSTGAADGMTCATAGDCASRHCRDAVCCATPCDGTCQTCGASGACVSVTSADDPDTCTGQSTCDANGACKKKSGTTCSDASECASGSCADGFCCDRACDGACEACNAPPGVCTVLPRSSAGSPTCAPMLCDGVSGTCPTRCASDGDCAAGFACDVPSGTCRSGSVCSDLTTVRAPTRTSDDCRPYLCRDGACMTSCSGVVDCAFPATCDESGRCVAPPSAIAAGGCAVAPPRSTAPRGTVALLGALLASLVAVGRKKRRER